MKLLFKHFSLLFLGTFIFSCTSNTTVKEKSVDGSGETIHSTANDTIVTNNKPVTIKGCYEMVMKQDTASMILDLKDSTITGNLNYHFMEKDQNTGTLKGVISDQYIYADYTFQSEGTTSVREVVFKIEGETLLPGFGAIREQNNKIVFADKTTLQFQYETPFLKIACAK